MTPHQLILAFIYFFVLLVVLPVFCSDKIYSLFYQEDPLKNQEVEAVNRVHRQRGVKEYMREIDAVESSSFHRSLLHGHLDHLIVIIARTPKFEEDRVLSQLVTEVDRNIRVQRLYNNAVLICNTTTASFEELDQLSRYYPVIQAQNTTKLKRFNKEDIMHSDFVDCIRLGQSVAQFKHITLIRDVVVPYSGFLETLNQILYLRLHHETRRGELVQRDSPWLFLHLQEPVPFRQYQFTSECVWELTVLGVTGGALFYIVFRYLEGPSLSTLMRVTYTFYGALYFITFAVVIGRPYISELRRSCASLYRVYHPSEPVHFSAMTLHTDMLQPLLLHLSNLRSSLYLPFHETLDHMMNTLESRGFVLSPSLFRYAARNPQTS